MLKFILSGIKRRIKTLRGLTAESLEIFLSRRILGRDLSELIVYLSIIIYVVVFSHFTIMKHNAFRSYAWDLGIYNQAFWTTLNQGKLFYCTPELFYNPTGSYFGVHFSPTLFLILPVYAIHQTPETLLVFQSFIIALGAIPLYWLARDSLRSKLMALSFSTTYFLYPLLHGANWFDFHVQSFLPLFFFLAMHYLKCEKWTKYFAFVILALAIAESVSIVVLFIGFYAFWSYRQDLFTTLKQKALSDIKILIPFLTMVLAVSWFLIVGWMQSSFFPIDPHFSEYYRAVDYWSLLGIQDNPVMMPIHIILNPLRVFNALAYDAYLKLIFVVLLFGPLLFLSFRSSILLITLAWLGPALLSNYPAYYQIGVHYPLYLIPFVFSAAVDGMKRQIPTPNFTRFGTLARNFLFLGASLSLFISPLSPLLATIEVPLPYFSEYPLPKISEHTIMLQTIVELVPSNATILTQNNIFPHFSDRHNAYVFPLPNALNYAPEDMKVYVDQLINKSEYILVDMKTDVHEVSKLISNSMTFKSNFGSFAEARTYQIYLYRRDYDDGPILFS